MAFKYVTNIRFWWLVFIIILSCPSKQKMTTGKGYPLSWIVASNNWTREITTRLNIKLHELTRTEMLVRPFEPLSINAMTRTDHEEKENRRKEREWDTIEKRLPHLLLIFSLLFWSQWIESIRRVQKRVPPAKQNKTVQNKKKWKFEGFFYC